MTDVQLLTIVLTLLAILGSVWANRRSVEDMRDVLRAEAQTQAAELRLESLKQHTEVMARIDALDRFLREAVMGKLDELDRRLTALEAKAAKQ